MQNYFKTTPNPVIAVDFDYFRLPRERWELLLTRLKQMGTTAIVVNVPWGFHEFNQGSVDLTGSTTGRRDLKGLLDLCPVFDLQCILNPGPYNHQGVLGEGIPLWLLNEAGDLETVLSTTIEGWYRALSRTLLNHQWPNGPLIALQVQSESTASQQPPYSKQLTEVKWRIWLRKHYDSIEALNEAYSTDYRTINDVKFPTTWSNKDTPLEKDAREFLEKVQRDTQTHYAQTLTDAGWQIPVYPSAKEIHPDLPAIQTASLLHEDSLPGLDSNQNILVLHHPIQVDPDPVEIGQTPTWASGAPIQLDGSVSQKFRVIRQALWPRTLSGVTLKEDLLKVTFKEINLVTGLSQAPLKFDLEPKSKPHAYKLRLNGELLPDDRWEVKRGKLNGPYTPADRVGQVDLNLIFTTSSTRLHSFPQTYLLQLLTAQLETLKRCAMLSKRLGQALTSEPEETLTNAAPQRPPAQTLNTLEEARRGLQEADAALRRAITSISGLEDGFSTILSKISSETPQPAASSLTISPDAFDSQTRTFLIEIGTVCTEILPQLRTTITGLQQIIEAPDTFTVEQYQQGYNPATETAHAVRQPLLKAITQLRQAIGAEKLPLLVWRIHDQLQEIAESLRWGVLRA